MSSTMEARIAEARAQLVALKRNSPQKGNDRERRELEASNRELLLKLKELQKKLDLRGANLQDYKESLVAVGLGDRPDPILSIEARLCQTMHIMRMMSIQHKLRSRAFDAEIAECQCALQSIKADDRKNQMEIMQAIIDLDDRRQELEEMYIAKLALQEEYMDCFRPGASRQEEDEEIGIEDLYPVTKHIYEGMEESCISMLTEDMLPASGVQHCRLNSSFVSMLSDDFNTDARGEAETTGSRPNESSVPTVNTARPDSWEFAAFDKVVTMIGEHRGSLVPTDTSLTEDESRKSSICPTKITLDDNITRQSNGAAKSA